MATSSDDNMYGSGLNRQDWYSLCNVLSQFLEVKDPSKVEIPEVPAHLKHHAFMEAIRSFEETGDDRFLDKAGKCLVPSAKEPFGWYLAVTKS